MKRLFYSMLMVLGTMAFVACSDDDEEPVYHYGSVSATSWLDRPTLIEIGTFNEGDTIYCNDGRTLISSRPTIETGLFGPIEYHKYACKVYFSGTVTFSGNIKGIYSSWDCRRLDVSDCPALEYLWCSLTGEYSYYDGENTLDVSENKALKFLSCINCKLTTLDVSNCPDLEELDCCANDKLTTLDISNCPDLEELDCSDCNLTTLDISQNTALTRLICDGNQFSESELNKIYEDLPTVKGGRLRTFEPDSPITGDYRIAEEKGWTVLK